MQEKTTRTHEGQRCGKIRIGLNNIDITSAKESPSDSNPEMCFGISRTTRRCGKNLDLKES